LHTFKLYFLLVQHTINDYHVKSDSGLENIVAYFQIPQKMISNQLFSMCTEKRRGKTGKYEWEPCKELRNDAACILCSFSLIFLLHVFLGIFIILCVHSGALRCQQFY